MISAAPFQRSRTVAGSLAAWRFAATGDMPQPHRLVLTARHAKTVGRSMAMRMIPAFCVPTSTLSIGSEVWAEAGSHVANMATKWRPAQWKR